MEGKNGSDDLFDRLNTLILNKHLNELMEGLTAKVFRTYNASWTLQEQLKELTDPGYSLPEMVNCDKYFNVFKYLFHCLEVLAIIK